MKTQATANVVVTLSVPAGSNWGPGCSAQQIHQQAINNVKGTLASLFAQNLFRAKMIGEPKVQIVLVDIEGKP